MLQAIGALVVVGLMFSWVAGFSIAGGCIAHHFGADPWLVSVCAYICGTISGKILASFIGDSLQK